jgi:hypothetical protein
MSHSRPVGIWMPYDAEKEPIKITVSAPKVKALTKEK